MKYTVDCGKNEAVPNDPEPGTLRGFTLNGEEYLATWNQNDLTFTGYRSAGPVTPNDAEGQENTISRSTISNTLTGVSYVTGATGTKLGTIIKNRSRYGTPNPRTIIRTPVGGVELSTKVLARAGTVLKVTGAVAGAAGLFMTVDDLYHNRITGTEASVDAAFGLIGFTGWGAPICVIYFGGKFLYEQTSGKTLFKKPEENPSSQPE